jgi:DNA polymerase III subunit epsilon
VRDEPVEEAVFVAFDTETTGLIAGVDRLVEVAAVAFGRGRILAEHEQLVDPGIPIPPHVSAINKVTDGMVRGMPSIAQALPAFFEALGRGMPVAHNAGFDVGFLVPVAREAGLSAPGSPILDTRLLARAAFPGRYSYSLSNLTRDLSPPPLEGVGAARGGAHSALADARACASLFELCVRALAHRGCRTVDDIVRINGPRLDLAANAPRLPVVAAMLERARQSREAVEIEYVSARGERTVRGIRPLAFAVQAGTPVVSAFCMLRGEERTFRLDSIRDVRTMA